MEIANGIHSIPAGPNKFMGMYAPNVYLVAGRKGALIDSGYFDGEATEARLEYLRNIAPLRLSHILVTHPHPDHIGGCLEIREATGAGITIHSTGAANLGSYGITADKLVDDGDVLDLGGIRLEVIYTPGHTRDSTCFFIRESGILFTGDHIVGFGTSVIDEPGGDVTQYIDSLKRLLTLPVGLICPGHGPEIREPERKIKELIAHRLEREQQILSCLGKRSMRVNDLVSDIYPELDPRLAELARKQIRAHLNKLVRDGKAVLSGAHYSSAGHRV